MTNFQEQSNTILTEAEFVQTYGNNLAVLKDGTFADFTINEALEVEAIMCQGKPEKRQDPVARLKKLGKFVGEAALFPEHRWLLVEEEN
jgi:hypothetical protein